MLGETKQEFPPRGRVVTWLPSRESELPAVTNDKSHRKLKVHVHGFHCSDAKDPESRKKATSPEEFTAEIFYKGRRKDGGQFWKRGTKREYEAFNLLPDSDVIMRPLVKHADEVFLREDNWGKKDRCKLGDCLYAVVMVYAPMEMFQPGAVAISSPTASV